MNGQNVSDALYNFVLTRVSTPYLKRDGTSAGEPIGSLCITLYDETPTVFDLYGSYYTRIHRKEKPRAKGAGLFFTQNYLPSTSSLACSAFHPIRLAIIWSTEATAESARRSVG